MQNEEQNYWDNLFPTVDLAKNYIRGYGEGVDFPSRMEVLKHLPKGESFLDVGCGNGCEYENMKKYGWEGTYKGVDYSHIMIEASKELFPETSWEIQDANHLDEKDQSWDTVLLRHVLECLAGYKDAVQEAFRVARKRVIIVFWIPPEDKDEFIGYNDEPRQANRYNKKDFFDFLHTLTNDSMYKEYVGKSNMVIICNKK